MSNVNKKSEGKTKKLTTTKFLYLSKKLIEIYRKKSIRIIFGGNFVQDKIGVSFSYAGPTDSHRIICDTCTVNL